MMSELCTCMHVSVAVATSAHHHKYFEAGHVHREPTNMQFPDISI